MLFPDKGSRGEADKKADKKADENDEGQPLPGTARHREFYPEGVAKVLQVSFILIYMKEMNKITLNSFWFVCLCML